MISTVQKSDLKTVVVKYVATSVYLFYGMPLPICVVCHSWEESWSQMANHEKQFPKHLQLMVSETESRWPS